MLTIRRPVLPLRSALFLKTLCHTAVTAKFRNKQNVTFKKNKFTMYHIDFLDFFQKKKVKHDFNGNTFTVPEISSVAVRD